MGEYLIAPELEPELVGDYLIDPELVLFTVAPQPCLLELEIDPELVLFTVAPQPCLLPQRVWKPLD